MLALNLNDFILFLLKNNQVSGTLVLVQPFVLALQGAIEANYHELVKLHQSYLPAYAKHA